MWGPQGSWRLHQAHLSRAAVLVLLALMVYVPSLNCGFTMDDPLVTSDNLDVADCELRLGRYFGSGLYAGTRFETRNNNLYRPLLKTSLALDLRLAGCRFDARWFHGMNLALYVWCIVTAFYLLRRLLHRDGAQANLVAFLVAALFAVFPSHLESVCNIKHREEIMACVFGFSSWILILKGGPVDSPHRVLYTTASAVLFLLAVLSKESALLLLPCILLWDVTRERRLQSASRGVGYRAVLDAMVPTLALGGAAALYLALRIRALGAIVSPSAALTFFHPGEDLLFRMLLTAGVFLKYYLWDQLFALQLNPAFSSRFLLIPGTDRVLANACALAGLAILFLICTWRVVRGRSVAAYGVVFFFVTSFFAWNVIPTGTAGAFRLMFMPSFGLCIAVVLGLRYAAEKACNRARLPKQWSASRVCAAATAVLILCYAVATRARIAVWRDDGVLFAHAVAVGPGNPMAHMAASDYHMKRGRSDLAVPHRRQSLNIFMANLTEPAVFDGRTRELFARLATEEGYAKVRDDPRSAIRFATIGISQFEQLQAHTDGRVDTNIASAYYVKALAEQRLGLTEACMATCRAGLSQAFHRGLAHVLKSLEDAGDGRLGI